MKEQIYTIPVNDGFMADSECPFCAMREKLERDVLDYVLGPSYMEQDVRDITNEKGFCREHYRMMYDAQNRLGLALMVSTHMAAIEKEMTALTKAAVQGGKKKPLFGKKTEESGLSEAVKRLDSSCFVCDKINASMDRYFDTFFYLWKKEPEFREKVKGCKGFCINDFERLVSMSEDKLGLDARRGLLEAVEKIQNENFERVRQELLWFINKFDCKFRDEPWGTSRDSLHRAILKVASYDTEKKYKKE